MAQRQTRKHFVIPDTQCKPGVPLEHLEWAGRYIAEKEPAVIVHIGDHWDMPSLSSYDRGKLDFEGRRYKHDIAAGNRGMALLNKGLGKCKARRIFVPGNHEDRITRMCQDHPEFDGLIGTHDFDLDGWEVQEYLRPISIDGILYCHYFYNPKTGRPWGGMASNMLRHVGKSFVMGHRQGLDTAMHDLPDGTRHRGVIAGSFYQHTEKYLGPQGNHPWVGVLALHEVKDGDFDIMEVSLDFLRRRYS